MRTLAIFSLLIVVLLIPLYTAQAKTVELDLQRRDSKTGEVFITQEKVDPSKIGVVVIDMWDYQGCVTVVGRIGAMIERMNESVGAARELGMQVLWSPTDIAGMYVGTEQYERALGFPNHPVPEKQREFNIEFSVNGSSCMCGPGIECPNNWGFSRQHKDLVIADKDMMITGEQGQLYSICKELGLTHLIYMGVHTNICLTYRGVGAKMMSEAGFQCYLARDLTDPVSYYNPAEGFTPDDGLAQAVRDVEKAMPSINLLEEMKKAGALSKGVVSESVSIVPWGMQDNPYLFEDSVTVTLGFRIPGDAQIRYTVDGSEPKANSTIYNKPLKFSETTLVRAAAFRKNKKVSLVSVGYFTKLGAVPPKPDVYMDEVEPMPRTATWPTDPPYLVFFWIPKMNTSFEGHRLRINGKEYDKGMGMRAPGNFLCEVKPEYNRFVALAGVDDHVLNRGNGALVGSIPNLQFRIFIDGKMADESPVMKVNHVPWRFDVKIPEGARIINLTATDAGSRSMIDLANWVDAGFVLKQNARNKSTVEDKYTTSIIETKVLCKQPGKYIGWPSIAQSPNGDLLAVFSGSRAGHVSNDGIIQMVRSSDSGKTWSGPVTVFDTPIDDRDSGIIQTDDGTMLVSWFTGPYGTQWQGHWTIRSTDNGYTWDKPVRTEVTTPHGPTQLSDGRILFIGQRPHCSHTDNFDVGIQQSVDDGLSWQTLCTFPVPASDLHYDECHVVECASGKLVIVFRSEFDPRHMLQSESTDSGATWSPVRQTRVHGYPPHVIRLQNDWLLAVYGKRWEPFGQYACVSKDEGVTWDVENEIKLCGAPNGDLGYPASTQLPDGTIWTVYYQQETDGEMPCLMGTHWRIEHK
jgi:sialidase-1